jgi:hypothetical protein
VTGRSPADEPSVDPAHSLAAIRDEVLRLRSGLARIEAELAALERSEGRGGPSRARPERYLKVLVAVYERGGRHGVDPEAFGAIGGEHGYDRRGLGGFFTGARAPLRRAGGRITLTPYGEHLVDVYLGGLGR